MQGGLGFVRSDEFLGEPALHVGVSKNSGTLKSSFFIWVFHCVNHPFWGFSPYIWKRPFCCQVFCVADGMGFLRPKKKEPTTSHASKHMSTCISVYIYIYIIYTKKTSWFMITYWIIRGYAQILPFENKSSKKGCYWWMFFDWIFYLEVLDELYNSMWSSSYLKFFFAFVTFCSQKSWCKKSPTAWSNQLLPSLKLTVCP